MSFSNRIAYTQSPGGIRRGLIWQSSDIRPRQYDSRNVIFCDVPGLMPSSKVPGQGVTNMTPKIFADIPGGLEGHIFIPNDGSISGTVPTQYLNQVPILQGADMSSLHEFVNQMYPYVDGVDAMTDELSYYVDIDMYISPRTSYVGYTNEAAERNTLDTEDISYKYYNLWQLNQNQEGTNKGYYNTYPGESFPVPDSDISQYLERDRLALSPCAYRIKGRLWYSDYPYAMTSVPGDRTFPFTDANDFILSLMSQYTVPSDDIFVGSAAKNNEATGFYDVYTIPRMTDAYGTRYKTGGSGSNLYYYMNKGVVYSDADKMVQMFLSPILYPMVGSTQASHQVSGDYYCRIVTNPDYQAQYNTDLFFKHATPGIISPCIKLPGVTGYDVKQIDGTIVSPSYKRQTFVFGSGINYPYMSGMDSNTPTYLKNSTLGTCETMSFSGSAAQYSFNFTDLLERNPTGSSPYVRFSDSTLTGWLQPKVQYHEKYIQDIDTAVSMCRTTSTSGGPSGTGFSGRFKFVGFKGKLSLFETGR